MLLTSAANDERRKWLEDRRSCIGASDSPAILGIGYANQSPLTVYASKVLPLGEQDGDVDERLQCGSDLEPGLRRIFTRKTGLQVVDVGLVVYRHDEYPWLGCTPDGLAYHPTYGRVPVELKNVDNFHRHEWDDEATPMKFVVQCQHQMAVLGSSHAFLLGLIGGNFPQLRVIERNDRFIVSLIKKLARFWECVQRQEPPPVDDSEASSRILAHIYREEEGTSAELPDEALNWHRELEEAKAAKKAAEAREIAAANKLKAAIGEHTFGVLPDGSRYSWKTQEKESYVVKASITRVLRRMSK